MFESYSIIYPAITEVGSSNIIYYKFEVIDSDFKEIIVVKRTKPVGLNIWSATITLYKEKNLNVGANLAKLLIYLSDILSLEPKKYLDSLIYQDKDIAGYEEDIKKYLILM